MKVYETVYEPAATNPEFLETLLLKKMELFLEIGVLNYL